ncbi:hypothetical protein H6G54_26490 [Anabaena cylindrica FACHB-243]|uniref:Phytochrome chromophore attachment site domain-containing protein n=1 Tax=Anabaena cylindrica (strain ATCC 27899 / PCC 7122) TaxID=272123 RepID=K9ZE51_ANACC|nr:MULTISPECIES: hypothetical protein [Anabaena]AFZ57488.1 hypothetical protein Anacy_2005 [Anabaena cylindrica PCC 7122]MBD2421171.1 hypothetical protein [Anabaena cylindrica FACHB-243]MBY5281731.1 hypothetical protein [Anabaena sp. CCAP 1446/1C]MBY5310314.1 hypothetical protein [Anabaena sp. CCAP 1446/1C]MCM2405929.1 hypothetical protein [Anabaena sp. CCAP 1446/1C]
MYQGNLLSYITDRISQSLELPEILATTAAEIRTFLRINRVKIYQFHEDGSGEVVAQSIQGNSCGELRKRYLHYWWSVKFLFVDEVYS